MTRLTCPVVIEPLLPEEGGGFLALVPDLPGCMRDGASPKEAVADVQDAIDTWIEAANNVGHAVPAPSRHLVLEAAHQVMAGSPVSRTSQAHAPRARISSGAGERMRSPDA